MVDRISQWHPTPMDTRASQATVFGVAKNQTWLSDFIFTFHFRVLEKEMATHSSVLAWRVPGMEEPGGLPSMRSHRVGPDWSDLAAAAAWLIMNIFSVVFFLISERWESVMCRWENSLVVRAHTCVHVVGLGPGNAATSVCVPSHSHSLPLWGTLQDRVFWNWTFPWDSHHYLIWR